MWLVSVLLLLSCLFWLSDFIYLYLLCLSATPTPLLSTVSHTHTEHQATGDLNSNGGLHCPHCCSLCMNNLSHRSFINPPFSHVEAHMSLATTSPTDRRGPCDGWNLSKHNISSQFLPFSLVKLETCWPSFLHTLKKFLLFSSFFPLQVS